MDEKEQRKQLRRERISGSAHGESVNEAVPTAGNEQKYLSDEQISTSFENLDDVQAKSTRRVTEVRVRTDQREARRRDDEERGDQWRNEILEQVQDPQQDEEVASGWKQCAAATNVKDLCELLDKQKTVCEAAMGKLDLICRELGSDLREKDHEYVTALKRNRQEVDKMQECIAHEHAVLKKLFEKELKLIEAALEKDRSCILNANREELDALISKRKTTENESLERQRQTIDDNRNTVTESESKGENDREVLKKKLQSDVRRLEIELEDTRARHQFDTDKLEYNVRVLTELSENEEAVKKQKRRIMKGKEELNRELEDKQDAKAKGIRQNEILESDCERIEKQSSGLKEKFERFKVSDDEKYRAVLGMHREDLQKLRDELKQSQTVIFGGALGCGENAEQSCASDVTWQDETKSNEESGNKVDTDEFGLKSEEGIELSEGHDISDEWKQAETLMSNYRTILERREGLNSEVASMKRHNVILEDELKSKLKEEVNDELAFPPSSMISVDAT
ncbi:hypothetical protein ACHAWF_013545 [Thalassiosira exigua]